MSETDRIERDVLISAPVDRVWELITSAQHLGRWFGDAGAEIELRPGGLLCLKWHEHETVYGRVVAVEPPRRFAYRWLLHGDPETEATPANSTLTEFTLLPEGEGTRVTVVESGYDSLDAEAAYRAERLANHEAGWVIVLSDLAGYAVTRTE